VPNQGPNVADSVPDHRGSFETDAPSVDVNVFGETHWFKHLRSEHSAVSDLDPFLEWRVVSKDLE